MGPHVVGVSHLNLPNNLFASLCVNLFPIMLRHSTGYKLANNGHDTRSLAHYLGHRNLQSTARYTALAPDRFKGFWKDYTEAGWSVRVHRGRTSPKPPPAWKGTC
jgi:hypothetical protein